MKILNYILLFYVGFYFYRLAENHKKNKWVFGILGIVTYNCGYFLYVLYYRFFLLEDLVEFTFPKIGFFSFITGLAFVFVLFQILSFVWAIKKRKIKNELDKIGK